MIIGSHVSMSGPNYYLGSVLEAISYNANTFMIYTGAPTSSLRTPISNLKINEALDLLKKNDIDINNVVVHAPYIINPASLDKEKEEFAINMLIQEIDRTYQMHAKYLVLHPGSSLDFDKDEAINQVSKVINIANLKNPGVMILIETMAGKGKEVGKDFQEISKIIKGIEKKELVGVCFDTCHTFDSGYNLENIDEVLKEFDEIIGLNKIKVIHFNDSKNILGSSKDRHENIGFGNIGFNTLMNIINHPKLKDKIFILETPYIKENEKDKISYPPYLFEINMIRNNLFNTTLKKDVINYYKH